LGDLTGYRSTEGHRLAKVYVLATHLAQIHPHTLAVGLLTIAVVLLVQRTRLASFALMMAMVAATLVTHLFGWEDVRLVGDAYSIPASLPLPILPELSLLSELTFTGVAAGIVGLVQGAGVSQSYPNPDGSYPNISADFR